MQSILHDSPDAGRWRTGHRPAAAAYRLAHGLLASPSMWLGVAQTDSRDGREEALASLAALAGFLGDLQARFRPDGLEGLSGAVHAARQLRAVLDGIPAEALAGTRNDLEVVRRWLEETARRLDALTALKRRLDSPGATPT
jgi:hypothetical protein